MSSRACGNIRGPIPRPCLQHPGATATYVPYRTYRQSKQVDTASRRWHTATSLAEPVFLRSSSDVFRVICLQDHFMFQREAARVCEQSRFGRFRPRRRKYPTLVSIVQDIRCTDDRTGVGLNAT